MGWDEVGRRAGEKYFPFFSQYCSFLMPHRCSRCAARVQRSSQGSERTLGSKTGASAAVGGRGEEQTMVSKEAEIVGRKCER